jgi:hypothetical protein
MEVICRFKIILWFWEVRAFGEAEGVCPDHNETAYQYFGLALAVVVSERLFAGKWNHLRFSFQ